MPRRNPDPYNNDELRELLLWQENTDYLYRLEEAIRRNLASKITKGKYDSSKAPAAWQRLADVTSKSYKEEFGYGFSAKTRRDAAQFWTKDFEREVREMSLAELLQTAAGRR